MKIRSWSRCWYEEFCSLGRITPTTVNGVSPRKTCCPTGASCSNSSLASSLPSAATRLGDDVAHQAVRGNDAGDGGRGSPDAAPYPRATGDELGTDVLDLVDFAGEQRHVIRPQPDRAAVAEARERLGGAAAEQDHDPVAQPVEALYGLALQPDAECQQHHDRDGAPGDPDDREGGAELLRPQVVQEFTPHVR